MAQDFERKVIISTEGEAQAVDALKKVDDAAAGAEKSSASLRTQLRDLQRQLSDLDPNSDKFQELSKQAGELKDRMNDAAEATRANAGPAFESLGNNFGLLTDRLSNLDFEGVGQSLKGIAGNIKGVKFGDLANGAKSLAGGFKAIGTSLLGNPIFLIGAVVIGLGVALFELKDKLGPVKKAFDALAAGVKFVTDLVTGFTDAIGLTTVAADNALSQTQAMLDANVKQANATRRRMIADAKRNNTSVEDVERAHFEKMKAIYQEQLNALDLYVQQGGVLSEEQIKKRQELNDQLQAIQADQYDFETEQIVAQRKAQEDAAKEAAAKAKERAEQRKREAAERKKLEEDTAKELDEITKQLEAENLAEEKAALEARKAALVKANEDRIRIEDEFYKAQAEVTQTAQEKEIADAVAHFEELAAAYDAAGQDTAELQKKLNRELSDINDKYRKEEKDKKDADALEEKNRKKDLRDAEFSLAAQSLDLLFQLNDSFSGKDEASRKRAFERNKKLQIAQALISTYQGATAAYAAAAASPITVAFPGYPFVQAGLAVAAGVAQVNKIRQTQFEGGGGGGSSSIPSTGASGGGGQSGTPQSPINTSFLQNRPDQNALQAYVIAGQVTDKQEVAQKIKDQSRL